MKASAVAVTDNTAPTPRELLAQHRAKLAEAQAAHDLAQDRLAQCAGDVQRGEETQKKIADLVKEREALLAKEYLSESTSVVDAVKKIESQIVALRSSEPVKVAERASLARPELEARCATAWQDFLSVRDGLKPLMYNVVAEEAAKVRERIDARIGELVGLFNEARALNELARPLGRPVFGLPLEFEQAILKLMDEPQRGKVQDAAAALRQKLDIA